MKDWLSRCNQTKEKHLLHSFHITCLMCSLVLPLTISLQLVASYNVPSIFTSLYFTLVSSLLRSTQVLQKPCQGNFRKFQGFGKSRFRGSEKDRYFGRYIMYYYGIYDGDNNGSIIYILSSMFYVLDMLTKIY